MSKPKLIPQWQPTKEVREYLEKASEENGMTLTGYIKSLVMKDMKRGKRK